VTSTDVRVETQLTSSVAADDMSMSVDSTAGFYAGCTVFVERTGTNEESIHLAGVGATQVGWVRIGHPSGSYVTRKSTYFDLVQKFIALINTPGESVSGRYGPDQSGVIVASLDITLGIHIEFKSATGAMSRYGKLGNLDRVFVACGRTLSGVDQNGVGQGFYWTEDNGANVVFAGGDNDTKYHVSLNFAALTDSLARAVPMNTCRKIYMVFAPRFEPPKRSCRTAASCRRE
jgi:hypothetical protein